jgi:hypothetical protein
MMRGQSLSLNLSEISTNWTSRHVPFSRVKNLPLSRPRHICNIINFQRSGNKPCLTATNSRSTTRFKVHDTEPHKWAKLGQVEEEFEDRQFNRGTDENRLLDPSTTHRLLRSVGIRARGPRRDGVWHSLYHSFRSGLFM